MTAALEALLAFFALDFAIQWLACLVSSLLQTEIFFDLVGSCTFLLGALLSLGYGGHFHERQVMATTLVSVWALRLGTFLFMRILQAGKDSRFDGVRDVPVMLFGFWTIQGMWVFMVLLPVVALNVSAHNEDWWQLSDAVGIALWAAGFLIETVADYQKFFFRMDDANKGKFVCSGLWRASRHPNYFGEMVLWWGMYLLSLGSLHGIPLKVLGIVSPLFTVWALTSLSGIPLLEKAANKKWALDPDYQAYKQETPLLIPNFMLMRKPHVD